MTYFGYRLRRWRQSYSSCSNVTRVSPSDASIEDTISADATNVNRDTSTGFLARKKNPLGRGGNRKRAHENTSNKM